MAAQNAVGPRRDLELVENSVQETKLSKTEAILVPTIGKVADTGSTEMLSV